MKVKVDRELCQGHAVCEQLAPSVFRIDADGKSEVLVDSICSEAMDAVEEAVWSCPASAITLVDS